MKNGSTEIYLVEAEHPSSSMEYTFLLDPLESEMPEVDQFMKVDGKRCKVTSVQNLNETLFLGEPFLICGQREGKVMKIY